MPFDHPGASTTDPICALEPRPHQDKAIEKVLEELKQADRTTLVMACRTGKGRQAVPRHLHPATCEEDEDGR